jgi:UDP-GlcNAc:undecaprenyl-phosphate/decaprenyl-phosphate GlcNAc-1-phosphate transferase
MADEARLAFAFGGSLVVVLLAIPRAIPIAERFELLDRPRGWKVHSRSTPYLGGAAVLLGFTTAAVALGAGGSRFIALVVCGLALCVLGSLDDKVNLPISLRIGGVISGAVVLSAEDLGWSLFSSEIVNFAVTALWCLGVVNAINLLDLMDGVAAATAGAAALGIGVLALSLGDVALAALGLALCGACIGFLCFNLRSPSAIFLGDGGSMPIGFLLAAMVMSVPAVGPIGKLALPMGILLVGMPLFDLTFRVYSRVRRGISLMTAGPDSVANWLRFYLASPRQVSVALATGQAILSTAAALGVESGRTAAAGIAIVALCLGALLIWMLDRSGFGRAQPEGHVDLGAARPSPNVRDRRIHGTR